MKRINKYESVPKSNSEIPNFITMADEKYIKPLLLSVSQAKKIYPSARFYVYDCGLSEDSRAKLLSISSDVVISKWDLQLIEPQLKWTGKIQRSFLINYLKGFILSLWGKGKRSSFAEQLENRVVFEMKIFNKFLIINHHANQVTGQFVFLDADALIIRKFDELFDDSFDLGVTVRRSQELTWQFNDCSILNVGVIFFLGSDAKNKTLLREWHKQLLSTEEINCEQTALTRLLERFIGRPAFSQEGSVHGIQIENETNLRVKLLSCEQYNFNWIEEYSGHPQKNDIKILHFKSNRFETDQFSHIVNELDISTT